MKVKNMVPSVYYDKSRDFSYIGRIIEVVFNYLKSCADNVSINLNQNKISSYLVDLYAATVGFESKHQYSTDDLLAICAALPYLLKNKGNMISFEESVKVLLYSQQLVTNDVSIEFSDEHLTVNIPVEVSDTVLLEDLFEYILPVGVTYSIVYTASNKVKSDYGTLVGAYEQVNIYIAEAHSLAQVGNTLDNRNVDGTVVGSVNTDRTNFENRSMIYTGVVAGKIPGEDTQELKEEE
jgi:hypothetical protein